MNREIKEIIIVYFIKIGMNIEINTAFDVRLSGQAKEMFLLRYGWN